MGSIHSFHFDAFLHSFIFPLKLQWPSFQYKMPFEQRDPANAQIMANKEWFALPFLLISFILPMHFFWNSSKLPPAPHLLSVSRVLNWAATARSQPNRHSAREYLFTGVSMKL